MSELSALSAARAPSTVREADARAIARLLGATLALRETDLARKRHLMSGLARLIHADMWIWVVLRGEDRPGDLTFYSAVDGGWDDERQKSIAMGASWSPVEIEVARQWLPYPEFAITRSDAFDDATWYASALYREHREPAGIDDFMFVGFWVSPAVLSAIGVHRRTGRDKFSERDRQIARIVMSEIEWLHRAGLPEDGFPPVEQLTPRQRHVMLLLLAGNSRKVIAHAIDVSLHTVNEHVAAIYERFDVHSRAELMAKFVRERDGSES